MKIMRVLDKKVGETEYIKYRINIPKKVAENSKLLDKDVKVELKNGKIIIEKAKLKNVTFEELKPFKQ